MTTNISLCFSFSFLFLLPLSPSSFSFLFLLPLSVLSFPHSFSLKDYGFAYWVGAVIHEEMSADERAEAKAKKASQATLIAILRIVSPDWQLVLVAYGALAVRCVVYFWLCMCR